MNIVQNSSLYRSEANIQEIEANQVVPEMKVEIQSCPDCPMIKNHTSILYKKLLYIFGGYDGRKNHNTLYTFNLETKEWKMPSVFGNEPPGRNGHTATLVENKVYIIGGWLGSGPYAANDIYVLDLDMLVWSQPFIRGSPPGPCNMHSTDLIKRVLYVFRGGDGKDYLNDLHCFDIDQNLWYEQETQGELPSPRANHSSTVFNQYLYIFGGWDGSKRLNDLYRLDSESLRWTAIHVKQNAPFPRAGMSLCTLGNNLYLFGGSGPSASCFNDLHIFETDRNEWVQIDSPDFKQIKPRAGHSMTVYDRYLIIIGGSYAQSYFKDIYIIDTGISLTIPFIKYKDPAPEFIVSTDTTSKKLLNSLRECCNNKELSDITFIVEGKPFYGHKIILSLLSEKFRIMFSSGMKENTSNQIEVPHVSYPVFAAICQYLYTGEVLFGAETEGQELSLEYLLEFLSVSDEFMLDEIKMHCEKHLANHINDSTFDRIYKHADIYGAVQLKRYCEWYKRRFGQIILE